MIFMKKIKAAIIGTGFASLCNCEGTKEIC